jgi:secreted trypsin-like serine protease
LKKIVAALAAILVLLVPVAGASAQTGDAQPDGNGHPNVGALLAKRTDGSLAIICSGTLVSTRVFLTAGHCTSYMENTLGQHDAFVTFDPNFGTDPNHDILSTPYHGKLVTNPAWHQPYQNDTAIVLLDKAIENIAPAKIAPLGLLDSLKKNGTTDDYGYLNVGYGTAEQLVVPKIGPTFPFDGIRKWTISQYSALGKEYIHLNQKLAQGNSGTGYGDSGGPTFVDTGTGPVIVSVVSTGDTPCYATSVNERVDTANAQTFLAPYLALR